MKLPRCKEFHESGFDLTSMIDITMLLIVFFMMTAQFSKTLDTPLDLPKQRGETKAPDAPHTLVIDLTTDGSFMLQGSKTDLDGVLQAVKSDLRKATETQNQLEVTVRADQRTSAKYLNQLASGLRAIGVRDWRLATQAQG